RGVRRCTTTLLARSLTFRTAARVRARLVGPRAVRTLRAVVTRAGDLRLSAARPVPAGRYRASVTITDADGAVHTIARRVTIRGR
ncbi:MAG: hypothetical protein RJQ03_00440, partial [Miltoncostaeaceae bacterium]